MSLQFSFAALIYAISSSFSRKNFCFYASISSLSLLTDYFDSVTFSSCFSSSLALIFASSLFWCWAFRSLCSWSFRLETSSNSWIWVLRPSSFSLAFLTASCFFFFCAVASFARSLLLCSSLTIAYGHIFSVINFAKACIISFDVPGRLLSLPAVSSCCCTLD